MVAQADRLWNDLSRVLNELENAPPAVRVAAAGQLGAWLQKHAPTEPENGLCGVRRRVRMAALFLAFALPMAWLIQEMASANCSSRNMPVARHEVRTLNALLHGSRARGLCKRAAKLGDASPTSPSFFRCKRPYPSHEAFAHPQEGLRRLRPERNTSDFPLLLAVGHGKTATKSLNKVRAQ